ncbi:Glycerol uptake/efflux facilitator protein [Pseudocercospora fuligena]|uniref:Glycerol uptake/efflux facilitator protein n=1 Tax=Pseudocercospora fuligena TaxID=685502 RepID=A0A8H6R6S0_9PEZI|nr:Glycerol uptake/efflux facilitator protein [Pseudocercospora fuligena]
MNDQGKTTSADFGNKSYEDPLALHNLPTGDGSVSHHEHAQQETLPPGEKQRGHGDSLDLHTTSSAVQHARQRLGLHPTAPIIEEHDTAQHADLKWTKVRGALKEPLAEFFRVMIMICFGDGSVAQVLLSAGQTTAPGGDGFGNYQSISWGWGLGVMLGIYIAGDSGAYLNPAITLTNCLLRKLPLRRFPIYFLAQFLGGFVGAGIVYANYINGINSFEGGSGLRTVPPAPNATAAIFCTYPQDDLTKASQFFSEFIASSILMFVIFALKDDSNKGAFSASGNWFPLALFFLIFGLGASFGWNTGYAINLARDFGPRLMSYAVGYGHEVWSAGGYYFWIPMVAPFCGCLFGGVLYDLCIYTGPSPINTPWFGLKELLKPREALEQRIEAQKKDGIV